MRTTKKLGIWMDHFDAHLMNYDCFDNEVIITSTHARQKKRHRVVAGEQGMHEKEEHGQQEFYQQLIGSIRLVDWVILFGPTSAKNELVRLIRKEPFLDKVKIEVQTTDHLTENQQVAFVKKYFEKPWYMKDRI